MSDYLLKRYTNHGESITVPDLHSLTIDEAEGRLRNLNLRFEVLDSAYDANLPPFAILDQVPIPLSNVKEYRKIYLTVNAANPPSVQMPNLMDKSLRQASFELESFGLMVGELIYKPDLAQNAVLEQLWDEMPVEPGTMVPRGSKIDLVLGDGLGNVRVGVPDLRGLTLSEVRWLLLASSLNLGSVIYLDEEIADTSATMVYRQIPSPENDNEINLGESINIFMTTEMPDSLKTGKFGFLDDTTEIDLYDIENLFFEED